MEKDAPRKSVEEKLRAIEEASRQNHPTADIDIMLREIEEGRMLGERDNDIP